MSFAQINYTQKVGNSPYAIKEIGCFITAFSNLLERYGEAVDPASLNAYFVSRSVYLADSSDHNFHDLLAWGSVSAYDGTIHVSGQGAGAPSSNDAIVKFVYKSYQTGEITTHFCLVADHAAGTIIDSWDGKVKNWSVYGGPKEWATYVRSAPQPVAPVQPISTPVPAAAPATLFTVEAIPAKQVKLKLNPTHLWNLNESNWSAMGANPVSDAPAGTVVDVHAIAHHRLGGTYYMPDPNQPHGYNIVDCEDYTAPPPTPPEPAKPQNVVFTKLETPLNLVTSREPTSVWDLNFKDDAPGDVVAEKQLPQGSQFVAFGKAQRTDHDKPCYYMTESDFGNADTSGLPTKYEGVNTVDLQPAPAPVEQVPAPAPVLPNLQPAPAPAPIDGEPIDVKVLPGDPLAFTKTFTRNLGPVEYVANTNVVVHDAAGLQPDVQLIRGQKVVVAGSFEKDGVKYLRTTHSLANGNWYQIPETALTSKKDIEDDNLLEEIFHDAANVVRDPKVIKAAATVDGVISRVFHKNKNKQ